MTVSSAAAHTNATTGGMNIVALPDHAGHINALTNIEFSRYRKMIEADLTPQQVIEFRAKLKNYTPQDLNKSKPIYLVFRPKSPCNPHFSTPCCYTIIC